MPSLDSIFTDRPFDLILDFTDNDSLTLQRFQLGLSDSPIFKISKIFVGILKDFEPICLYVIPKLTAL